MKYNFYCPECNTSFKKTVKKLTKMENVYGEFEGIKCPLCEGKAMAVGTASFLGGKSPNGIAPESKMIDLD